LEEWGLIIDVLDWELEISKRFAQPLFSESNEFPDPETIQKRMVPICYQEGLVGGCADGCSTLVNVAAEAFIKEQLTEIFKRVKSNGPNYIQTSKFRRRREKEEELARRGEIKRDMYGLLPVEVEVESKRRPFGLEDLRFSMLLGNSYLSQNKILSAKVSNAPYVEEEEDRDMDDIERPAVNGTPQKPNGVQVNGTVVNGINGHHSSDEIMTDVNEWWNGGLEADRNALDDMIDDVLATGF
jgi:transcriptional coactivator HFI1/ADA1